MSMPALFKGRLSLPVIGAPLFIISVPDLVIAQCKAGVVGSFPALNARPPELLDEWLYRIKEELAAYDKAHPERPSAPFAVNQIVHKSNNRLDHDMALCEKHKVPMIISSLGAREELNQAVHGWGGIVFHDVHQSEVRPQGDREGRRRPDPGRCRRRRSCRHPVAVPVRVGDAAVVRRTDRAVGHHRQWPRDSRRAHHRRRLRLYRLRLHRHQGGECGRGLQEHDHQFVRRGHRLLNLFTGVHGNYLKPSIVAAGMDPKTCRPPIRRR